MADIYPTTKEELKVLVFIAKLDDEKILSKYGITRKELLEKRPLNKSTLTALKTILLTSEKTIQNAFHQSKDEVLHLRTITVEMINDANQKFVCNVPNLVVKKNLCKCLYKRKKELTQTDSSFYIEFILLKFNSSSSFFKLSFDFISFIFRNVFFYNTIVINDIFRFF